MEKRKQKEDGSFPEDLFMFRDGIVAYPDCSSHEPFMSKDQTYRRKIVAYARWNQWTDLTITQRLRNQVKRSQRRNEMPFFFGFENE